VRHLRGRAWWVLAFFAAMIVVFGVGDALIGVAADPAITVTLSGLPLAEVQAQDPIGYRLFDFAARSGGMNLALLGLLLGVLIAVPYRAGQRWAWWTLWALPVWAALVPVAYVVFGTAPGQPPAPPMISGPIVAVVAALALLLDRQRFARAAS
jgi:hypothetical protein